MRILVIEDDKNTASNIRTMLGAEKAVVDIVDLGQEGALLGTDEHYDLILLDLTLPDMHGLRVLRELRAANVDTPILVISGDSSVSMRVDCLESGADDYLTKPFHRSELLARVHALSRRSGDHLKLMAEARDALARLMPLTQREREVLEKIVAGLPNKIVARELGISPRTVELHRANIMEKLHARSLPEVVRLALSAARLLGEQGFGSPVH